MNFETLFASAREKPARIGLIGAGEFGVSLIAQSRRMRGLEVVAVADTDPDRVSANLAEMGLTARRFDSAPRAERAIAPGAIALFTNVDDLLTLPLDMVVEATGSPEAGARHALAAIEAGVGVTMVTKEAECVVGPLLAAKARERGVPYALVDGDQPALLIALVSSARMLGLPVVAAGKSSEYDYVFDPLTETVTWTNRRTSAVGLADHWSLGCQPDETLAKRAALLAALPQRTVPDYCEMALVANATGLMPDRPDFHAPLTRASELPFIYRPKEAGGILGGVGCLDVFNCLRRSDEASFAGGVFVVVEWADERTGALLRGKGIPTTSDGRYGLLYNPSHLLGVEAPMSILAATRLGHSNLDDGYKPVVDLIARATADLPAGRRLDMAGARHAVPDLEASLLPAVPLGPAAPIPYYLAVGCQLARPVARGAFITLADVIEPPGALIWRLRREQDARFLASCS